MVCKRCETKEAMNGYCGKCRHILWLCDYVRMGMQNCANSKKSTAEYLGITRKSIQKYINTYPELADLRDAKYVAPPVEPKKPTKGKKHQTKPRWMYFDYESDLNDRARMDRTRLNKIRQLKDSYHFKTASADEQQRILERFDKMYQ